MAAFALDPEVRSKQLSMVWILFMLLVFIVGYMLDMILRLIEFVIEELKKMRAKEYLQQAYKIERILKSRMEQIARLESLATSATQAFGDSPPPSSHSGGSKVENLACQLADIRSETERDSQRLLLIRRGIVEAIRSVGDLTLEYLLEERYLNYRTFDQIADDMSLSKDYVFKLHRTALSLVHVPQ